MDIVYPTRDRGTTLQMIIESALSNSPIVCENQFRVNEIVITAQKLGFKIPEPINICRYMMHPGYYYSLLNDAYQGVLIDNLESVLNIILGKKVLKATLTNDVRKIPKQKEGEKFMNQYLDNVFDRISRDETTRLSWGPSQFWCYRDTITDINIIVPGKVVEITFEDGLKEKMVCDRHDTFDLRKCCFIAIAKHLYKKEYTQEGIEYMATQLTYQKKYVKIVDKALKDYKKKEEDKAEKIRKEDEEKIIRMRQRLKRCKQNERRKQRHKEVLVDLIADSINEAKARRKAGE